MITSSTPIADIACLVCRAKFNINMVTLCPHCGELYCPNCGAHQQMVTLGVYNVSPAQAAHVRASVWGRPN